MKTKINRFEEQEEQNTKRFEEQEEQKITRFEITASRN
jgi:hypothetical protein